jgi:hypothetical protein
MNRRLNEADGASFRTYENAGKPALDIPELIRASIRRLHEDLRRCPVASTLFWRRANELGDSHPENLFLNPLSTPVFLFPWWVELSFSPAPDMEFQSDLLYVCINLLYYVRILDDAMDGHRQSSELMPLLMFLHSRFQGGFQALFDKDDRFWRSFYRLIDLTTEVTAEDFLLKEVTFSDYMRLSAQKSCAALIPISAVLCRYKRYDEFDRWSALWTAFSAWNQMRDDLLDWSRDMENGTATYLLSEAARRKRADEDVPRWMLREGFDWAIDVLEEFAKKATELASKFPVPEMQEDLNRRYERVAGDFRFVSSTLKRIATIGSG